MLLTTTACVSALLEMLTGLLSNMKECVGNVLGVGDLVSAEQDTVIALLNAELERALFTSDERIDDTFALVKLILNPGTRLLNELKLETAVKPLELAPEIDKLAGTDPEICLETRLVAEETGIALLVPTTTDPASDAFIKFDKGTTVFLFEAPSEDMFISLF